MIEVASFPKDLAGWDPGSHAFYLELFGETQPLIDPAYGQLLGSAAPPGGPSSSPMYQYWWTIGHPGHPHAEDSVLQKFHKTLKRDLGLDTSKPSIWDNMPEPAARVYMFFPTYGNWRVKEFAATVDYLSPVFDQKRLWNQAAEEWKQVQPALTAAATLGGLAVGLPMAGAAIGGTASLLSHAASLKVNSVPQAPGFEWSVGKVTHPSKDGGVQGVMWTLPQKMFSVLGGRLTGSLTVSFILGQRQSGIPGESEVLELTPLPVQAHAVVYGHDGKSICVPEQNTFVDLTVSPQTASPKPGTVPRTP